MEENKAAQHFQSAAKFASLAGFAAAMGRAVALNPFAQPIKVLVYKEKIKGGKRPKLADESEAID